MPIILRPDQKKLLGDVRSAMKSHRRVCMQAPTGWGKTVATSELMRLITERGKRAVFGCHRIEILEQADKTFSAFGIPHGIVAPGFYPRPGEPIQIASIDTLRSRIKRGKPVPPADLYAIDECHHAVAPSWAAVSAYYKDAYILGVSATPERSDGKGLDSQFDVLVNGPSVKWLIDHGHLSDYRAFAPNTPDMTGVHTVNGEYDREETEALMDKSAITGDAIDHYVRHARGRKFIAYCVSVKHSLHTMEQFRAAGIPCWHVDGTTGRDERRMAMEDFRNGDLMGLLNCEIFTEGVDCPDAEVMIGLRPTKSLPLFLQMAGRVLRPRPGKTALLMDHGGNLQRHGLPDDERRWSLQGRKARKKAEEDVVENVATRQCPACFFVLRPAPQCPSCGHVFEAKPREVEERAGELVEIDKARVRQERLREQAGATTLEQLIAVGKARGYKNPFAWSQHLLAARGKKRA